MCFFQSGGVRILQTSLKTLHKVFPRAWGFYDFTCLLQSLRYHAFPVLRKHFCNLSQKPIPLGRLVAGHKVALKGGLVLFDDMVPTHRQYFSLYQNAVGLVNGCLHIGVGGVGKTFVAPLRAPAVAHDEIIFCIAYNRYGVPVFGRGLAILL